MCDWKGDTMTGVNKAPPGKPGEGFKQPGTATKKGPVFNIRGNPSAYIVEKAQLLLNKWKEINKKFKLEEDKLLKKHSAAITEHEEDFFEVEIDDSTFRFTWAGEPYDGDNTTEKAGIVALAYSDLVQTYYGDFKLYAEKLMLEDYDEDMGYTAWLIEGWCISINNWAEKPDEVEIEKVNP